MCASCPRGLTLGVSHLLPCPSATKPDLEPKSSSSKATALPSAALLPQDEKEPACHWSIGAIHPAALWAKSALSQPGPLWERADTYGLEE